MMKIYHIKKFLRFEYSFSDIINFFIGHLRYRCYYSDTPNVFIRKHILEQIDYRISVMDKQCFEQGYCKECGCSTTHLQMANKPCEGGCYPQMMNEKVWEFYKIYHDVKLEKKNN